MPNVNNQPVHTLIALKYSLPHFKICLFFNNIEQNIFSEQIANSK